MELCRVVILRGRVRRRSAGLVYRYKVAVTFQLHSSKGKNPAEVGLLAWADFT